jgi:hypothetical protein
MSGRADTPTPEFVGNSRVRGARSPPGTPRDLTTPSRAHLGPAAGHTDPPGRLHQSKAGNTHQSGGLCRSKAEKRRPPGLHQSKVGKSCAQVDFSRAKRRSVPPAGLSQSKVGKCARRRFRAAGRCARPGGEKPPARRKKNRVFFRPLRACIRKRGLLFRKKNR